MTNAERKTLETLEELGEVVGVSRLADFAGVARSWLQVILPGMKARGYVEIIRQKAPGRPLLVRYTKGPRQ